MGMYTEIFVCAQLKNLDSESINAINAMTGAEDADGPLPDHPLFATDRWLWLLCGSSYYFVPRSVSRFEYDDISKTWCLIARADIKNYSGEIEKFFDWITPLTEDRDSKMMIGYSRYEESDYPTLYFADGSKLNTTPKEVQTS